MAQSKCGDRVSLSLLPEASVHLDVVCDREAGHTGRHSGPLIDGIDPSLRVEWEYFPAVRWRVSEPDRWIEALIHGPRGQDGTPPF